MYMWQCIDIAVVNHLLKVAFKETICISFLLRPVVILQRNMYQEHFSFKEISLIFWPPSINSTEKICAVVRRFDRAINFFFLSSVALDMADLLYGGDLLTNGHHATFTVALCGLSFFAQQCHSKR